MKTLDKALVGPERTVLETMRVMDASGLQIALVVDENRTLLGAVTDGDVRRGLLRGVGLDRPVTDVMNRMPRTVTEEAGRDGALALMRRLSIRHVPVLDTAGRVVGLEWQDQLVKDREDETWVVLMLGGLGSRLRPLTEDVPKPMLQVGGRPLVETIVRNFVAQGFRRFFFSVNYKAEVFREYFGDGSAFGARIDYLSEEQKLGTAGALSLLPQRPDGPIIVMNGDLLTTINFGQLMASHRETRSLATMSVREYSQQIPYGVVETEGFRLTGVTEKPTQTYFINAGIYVLDPEALDLIPSGTFFDMPQLFDTIMARGGNASVFPIREYWLDIGRLEDLERAQVEYHRVFSG